MTRDQRTDGKDRRKAILVVSFGTSYGDTREKTIGAIEADVQAAFPDYEVRRAFTSQMILDILRERDGLEIDNVDQAMKKLVEDGVQTLIVQPTHVMSGIEYDQMMASVEPYRSAFGRFAVGEPLLSSAGDYERVVEIVAEAAKEWDRDGTAVVLMGHGTDHEANEDYTRLDGCFKAAGYINYIVGTVEAVPGLLEVKAELGKNGAKRVVLLPFMIVAGDHANHDMAGDEEGSWNRELRDEGYEVECVIRGLGEYRGIREVFVEHVRKAGGI